MPAETVASYSDRTARLINVLDRYTDRVCGNQDRVCILLPLARHLSDCHYTSGLGLTRCSGRYVSYEDGSTAAADAPHLYVDATKRWAAQLMAKRQGPQEPEL